MTIRSRFTGKSGASLPKKNENGSRKKPERSAEAGAGHTTRKPAEKFREQAGRTAEHTFKKSVAKPMENAVDALRKAGAQAGEKPDNVPGCAVAGKCGGCDYMGVPYERQMKIKQAEAEQYLKKFGPVLPIVKADHPLHYRNKVSAAFGYEKGRVISGVYEKYSHRIVNTRSCMIEDLKADRIISTIKELIRSFKIKTYDEDSGYGLLRHVMVRTARKTGEVMVILVTASPVIPGKNNFVAALREKHPEITTIIQNTNNMHTSMVLGKKEKVLYGKGYIEDELCGLRFRISSGSFYQVNPEQTEKLYRTAIEFAGLTGKEVLLDAYCGVGTIGMIASAKAKEVISVELNADAVRDAEENAKRNGIENIGFYANDAGVFLTDLVAAGKRVDVILMDPPRTGSTEAFMESAVKAAPKRIVYVSCNPETLSRDLVYFEAHGYQMKKAQPFDCFPATAHIETVVLLSGAQNAEREAFTQR